MSTFLSDEQVVKYQPMVRAAVNKLLLNRRWLHLSVDKEDLYQIGWITLIECLRYFDASRGVMFETYANVAIRRAINRELLKLSKRNMPNLNGVDVAAMQPTETQEQLMTQLIEAVEGSGEFSKRDKTIFWMRLDNLTFAEIGNHVGITSQRACQLYNDLVVRLKRIISNER